ncbi:hypothetical protein ACFVTZ_19445 [Cellulosimicrobium cellulans]|uniref:hypothetical protein n=1 Tax=Cellulosimicrobium cellulans TaxID=1710 RepID=UPI0036EA1889
MPPPVGHAPGQLGDDLLRRRDLLRRQVRRARAAERDRREALARREGRERVVVGGDDDGGAVGSGRTAEGRDAEQGDHHPPHEHAGEAAHVDRPACREGPPRVVEGDGPRAVDQRRGARLGEQLARARAQVVMARAVEQVEDPVAEDLRPQVPDPALADDREVPMVGEDAAPDRRVGGDPAEPRDLAQPATLARSGERPARQQDAGHRGPSGGEHLELAPGRGQGAATARRLRRRGRGRGHRVSVAHARRLRAVAPRSGDGHFTPSDPVDDRRRSGSAWLLCRACQ